MNTLIIGILTGIAFSIIAAIVFAVSSLRK